MKVDVAGTLNGDKYSTVIKQSCDRASVAETSESMLQNQLKDDFEARRFISQEMSRACAPVFGLLSG